MLKRGIGNSSWPSMLTPSALGRRTLDSRLTATTSVSTRTHSPSDAILRDSYHLHWAKSATTRSSWQSQGHT